jgi:hypothetical protein
LPTLAELRPGNAAPFYYRALVLQSQLPPEAPKQYAENEERWRENLSDPAVQKEVQAWVDKHTAILGQLKVATYREETAFDFRTQDLTGLETVGFLLPEIQEMRQLARLLQMKGLLEVQEGRHEDAIETLRMGYRLGQAAGEPRFLVAGLVGLANVSLMENVLRQLIASPEAPNLYWAIANLPRPLVDLRPAMQQEMEFPRQVFPMLNDVETAERSPEEWRKLLVSALGIVPDLVANGDIKPEWQTQFAATALVMKAYPAAKRELIAAGYDAQRVEAMPVGQVILWQTARVTDEAYQDAFKWWGLPYWQVDQATQAVDPRTLNPGLDAQASLARGALPLASILLPATLQVRAAEVRAERNLAALQAIEAMRLHAARTGSLPDSLDGLNPPAPLNPVTGKPFSYQRQGATAVLESPPLGNQSPRVSGLRYEIKLRDKGSSRRTN